MIDKKIIGPLINKTEAFVLADYYNKIDNNLLYIGKDDREIAQISKQLQFTCTAEIIFVQYFVSIHLENSSLFIVF